MAPLPDDALEVAIAGGLKQRRPPLIDVVDVEHAGFATRHDLA
jgi:hypothetical protein